MTAYGGTSYHSPSIFTRYLLSLISYSTSSGFQPSAVEQQPSPKVLPSEFAQALISGDVGPSCPWSAASAKRENKKNRMQMHVNRMPLTDRFVTRTRRPSGKWLRSDERKGVIGLMRVRQRMNLHQSAAAMVRNNRYCSRHLRDRPTSRRSIRHLTLRTRPG